MQLSAPLYGSSAPNPAVAKGTRNTVKLATHCLVFSFVG